MQERPCMDMAEWEFALDKEVAYKDTKSHHAVAFEASQMDALDWMKAAPELDLPDSPQNETVGTRHSKGVLHSET